MNPSTAVAQAVVGALLRAGVREVVLAPGSRSAALALALHAADEAGRLRLHVRIDERSAGFLALGLAKGSHRPVAVLTTSGTAVANLHPAVLEAHHVGESLIVLAADRPAALRGTGANQTTDQPGLFGPRVVCVDVVPGDAAAAATAIAEAAVRRGPTHLNLQFAEPLLPDPSSAPTEDSRGRGGPGSAQATLGVPVGRGGDPPARPSHGGRRRRRRGTSGALPRPGRQLALARRTDVRRQDGHACAEDVAAAPRRRPRAPGRTGGRHRPPHPVATGDPADLEIRTSR